MRQIDVRHLGPGEGHLRLRASTACSSTPARSRREETLLEALGGERPRALLLTHIHFDHAGAAGALVRRWPDLPRLRARARRAAPRRPRAAGRQRRAALRRRGGPARDCGARSSRCRRSNLHVLTGGERGAGAFEVAYTPGHASHHVCYLHQRLRLGVRRRRGRRADPAVRPRAGAHAAARHRRRGLGALARHDRRLGARPASRSRTSARGRPAAQLEAVREALHWRGRAWRPSTTWTASWPRCTSGSREPAPDDVAPTEQAAPLDHLFLGPGSLA